MAIVSKQLYNNIYILDVNITQNIMQARGDGGKEKLPEKTRTGKRRE